MTYRRAYCLFVLKPLMQPFAPVIDYVRRRERCREYRIFAQSGSRKGSGLRLSDQAKARRTPERPHSAQAFLALPRRTQSNAEEETWAVAGQNHCSRNCCNVRGYAARLMLIQVRWSPRAASRIAGRRWSRDRPTVSPRNRRWLRDRIGGWPRRTSRPLSGWLSSREPDARATQGRTTRSRPFVACYLPLGDRFLARLLQARQLTAMSAGAHRLRLRPLSGAGGRTQTASLLRPRPGQGPQGP